MILTVKPAQRLRGWIFLPASKSYSIRAFMVASCGGHSRIVAPSNCADAKVALSVAQQLGAKIEKGPENVWKVTACPNNIRQLKLDVKESGTVLRFLLPLLPIHSQQAYVRGSGTLCGRPNHHLINTLRSRGVAIKGQGAKETVPIIYSGGRLEGGKFIIEGSMSSQFISALLIACPQMDEPSEILIRGRKVVSNDYIVMTEQVLKKAGVKIGHPEERLFKIKGSQEFKGLGTFHVPSDFGLAAFHLAAGALVPSDLILKGFLKDDFVQADARILNFLEQMGVKFSKSSRSIRIRGPFCLRGGNFSLKDCPDLVPVMTVLALFAQGKTRLYDIQHARVKESDRISDLSSELQKVGAKFQEKVNELTIFPQKRYKNNQMLDPHADHRLAMAFAVLGLKIGVSIKNMGCVDKSYPDFVRDFCALGAPARFYNNY